MIGHTVFTIFIAFFFYVGVPALGALVVQARWRRFRSLLSDGSVLPRPSYSDLHTGPEGFLGLYQFRGTLRAMEGGGAVWVADSRLSLRIDMDNVTVYMVEPALQPLSAGLPAAMTPRRVHWRHISSVPEGARIFVSGALFRREGRVVFENSVEHPLLVVQYEGADDELVGQAMAKGRHKNEYLNRITPFSILLGVASLIVWGYALLQFSYYRFPPVLSLSLSLYPLIIFFPPGLVFFYLYIHFWRKGRYFRVMRDLFMLVDRFPIGHEVAPGEFYEMVRADTLESARRICPTGKERFLFDDGRITGRSFFIYGIRRPDGTFHGGSNPCVEAVVTDGIPEQLSSCCRRKACKWEVLSLGAYGLGFLCNLGLAFFLLLYLIK